MAKATITVFELMEKYLVHLGLSKTSIATTLISAKYEDYFMCAKQKKSNVVTKNKNGLSGNETHIAIPKNAWEVLFTPIQTSAFSTTHNTCETDQDFIFFEANIADILNRRAKKLSPQIMPATPIGNYSVTSSLLTGTGRKWIGEQNGATQVHIAKSTYDSAVFKDFRLGILIDDLLLLFKEKHSAKVLAVAIPYEFAQKYNIKHVKSPQLTANKQKVQKQASTTAHAQYLSSVSSSHVTAQQSPHTPQPAPAPKRASGGKPRYTASPSIGKGALQKAGYICENCGNGTFIARSTGNNFMEPHHLIPISCQGNYSVTIDITSNLICLCPNCHSKIHYGQKTDIEAMLKKFLSLRKTDLKNYGGIDIDEATLLAYYNI